MLEQHQVVTLESTWKKQELIARLDLALFSCGHSQVQGAWSRKHPDFSSSLFFRLWAVNSGSADLIWENQRLELPPGTLCMIPADCPFAFGNGEHFNHYWCHFNSDRLKELVPFQYPVAFLPSPEEFSRVQEDFQKLICQVQHGRELEDLVMIRHLLLSILCPCLKYAQISSCSREDHDFAGVIHYLAEHFHEKVLVSDLAKQMQMEPLEFSCRFKNKMGIPPREYILNYRLQRAKQLLTSTGLSTKEIAEQCGFYDLYLFLKQFKRVHLQTPTQYRQSIRKI